MKIYLAGPMRGIKDFNFPEFFRWAKILRDEGNEVFNPAEKGEETQATDNPDLQFDLAFRRKVFKLDTSYICDHADAVALMPEWRQSRGAQAERALAEAIGLRIILL